jgi:hypothetical protein
MKMSHSHTNQQFRRAKTGSFMKFDQLPKEFTNGFEKVSAERVLEDI